MHARTAHTTEQRMIVNRAARSGHTAVIAQHRRQIDGLGWRLGLFGTWSAQPTARGPGLQSIAVLLGKTGES